MLTEGKIINPGSDVSHVSYGDDSGLFVEFYTRETENKAKSQDAGRPIFESRDYVRIIPVGDKTKVMDRPVRTAPSGAAPSDLDRFPRQWEAFKRQETQVLEGTPVTEWPPITRADAMSLKALNIHTVEMLAGLQENNLTWLGARQMRDKAKAWIEKAKENASASQWASEKNEMQNQIDALQNQIQGLAASGVPIKQQQEASAPPAKPKKGASKKAGLKVKQDEQDISTASSASG